MTKYWNIALILSIISHLSFFIGAGSFLRKKSMFVNKGKDLEIIIPREIDDIENSKENILSDWEEINTPVLPYIDDLTALPKPQIIDRSIKETVMPFSDKSMDVLMQDLSLSKELQENPAYMVYYQTVREKVRDSVYQCYNSNTKGDVFLSFIVLSDGKLKDVHLRRESGISNDLINNALKSVKDASPFPKFPKELKDYPYLQFNLAIYFKNNS